MENLVHLFGDSYRAVSEIDILTFSLGLGMGLLVGIIPIPLPGGVTLKLGLAGGPLIVALIAGALGRTGPLVWAMPYSANLTLRQIGLVLFLAGIGTRAGYSFITTITQGSGLMIFAAGAVITVVTAFTVLWVGYKLLRIPMSLLIGILAGLQTQPAVLGYGLEQTHNELPNIGYSTVYPVAMILKIILAQIILVVLA
jgi:putative transport protein